MTDLNKLVDDISIDHRLAKVLSFVFLAIPIGISFMKFDYVKKHFFWFDEEAQFSFYPMALSTAVAIVLTAPLYFRNIFKWERSIYSIVFLIMVTFFFATIIELIFAGQELNEVNFENKNIYLILAAVVLSWLGMKGVAAISWVLVFIAVIITLIERNYSLGFPGSIYFIFGFLGLLLQTELNPGEFVMILKEEYRLSDRHQRNIKEVGVNAGKAVKEAANMAKDIAKNAAPTVIAAAHTIASPEKSEKLEAFYDKKEELKYREYFHQKELDALNSSENIK